MVLFKQRNLCFIYLPVFIILNICHYCHQHYICLLSLLSSLFVIRYNNLSIISFLFWSYFICHFCLLLLLLLLLLILIVFLNAILTQSSAKSFTWNLRWMKGGMSHYLEGKQLAGYFIIKIAVCLLTLRALFMMCEQFLWVLFSAFTVVTVYQGFNR